MKAILYILFLTSASALLGQEEADALPEPSEPPYEVGDFPLESGYTIEREDAPDLNFRLVDYKMRLYWIDENGLIMEPEVAEVSVRFDKRGTRDNIRTFFRFERLSDDTALGSPYILPEPHRYFVTLLIKSPDSGELESFRFRYLPAMDEVLDPESK